MKKLLILFVACLAFVSAQAQAPSASHERGGQRPSIEEFFTYKTNFIIKDLKLNAADSARFVPLYRDYMKAKGELMRNASGSHAMGRKMMRGETITDDDYLKAARGEVEFKVKESELAREWLAKFETVLTPQQLFSLLRAEEHFAVEMTNRHNHRVGGAEHRGKPTK